jgi:hypothetical protein
MTDAANSTGGNDPFELNRFIKAQVQKRSVGK